MEGLLAGVPAAAAALGAAPADAARAAAAITTPDLVTQAAALEDEVGGRTFRVGGMAKGSGMIHPNMATMLGVVTCDAPVAPPLWRRILKEAVTNSFTSASGHTTVPMSRPSITAPPSRRANLRWNNKSAART